MANCLEELQKAAWEAGSAYHGDVTEDSYYHRRNQTMARLAAVVGRVNDLNIANATSTDTNKENS